MYAKYYCLCYGEFTKRARICPLASGIIIALPCNRLCNLRHYELSLTPSSGHPQADSVLLVVYLSLQRHASRTRGRAMSVTGELSKTEKIRSSSFFSRYKNRSHGNLLIRRGQSQIMFTRRA